MVGTDDAAFDIIIKPETGGDNVYLMAINGESI